MLNSFLDSRTVYGQADSRPLPKKHLLKKPESPYGNTKKICENILEDKTNIETKLSTVILRYFNPIGAHPSGLIGEDPRNVPQNLVPIITKHAIGEIKKLIIYGERLSDQRRYLYQRLHSYNGSCRCSYICFRISFLKIKEVVFMTFLTLVQVREKV